MTVAFSNEFAPVAEAWVSEVRQFEAYKPTEDDPNGRAASHRMLAASAKMASTPARSMADTLLKAFAFGLIDRAGGCRAPGEPWWRIDPSDDDAAFEENYLLTGFLADVTTLDTPVRDLALIGELTFNPAAWVAAIEAEGEEVDAIVGDDEKRSLRITENEPSRRADLLRRYISDQPGGRAAVIDYLDSRRVDGLPGLASARI